jgi:4-carboxymuconolactone decarboxylase
MTQRIPAILPAEILASLTALPSYQRGGPHSPYNIYRTLAHHPGLVSEWTRFADALRFQGTLPGRSRELLILRTSVNTGCEYEWGQHESLARGAGMTPAELEALHLPASEFDWTDEDLALIRVADELHIANDISDDTWNSLAPLLTYQELIEVVMLVGQYHLVAYLMNGFRVERDASLAPFPRSAVLSGEEA